MRIRFVCQACLILLPASFLAAAEPAKLAKAAAAAPEQLSLSRAVKATAVAAGSGLTIDVAITGAAPQPSNAAYNETCVGDAVEIQLSAAGAAAGASPAIVRLVTDEQGRTRIEGVLPMPAQCGKLKSLRLPYTWDAAGATASVPSGAGYTASVRVPAALLAWLFPQTSSLAVAVRFLSADPQAACTTRIPPVNSTATGQDNVQQFVVRLYPVQDGTTALPPLLRAASAYIQQGPGEAAAILEGQPQEATLLPLLAVMRELAGDRDLSVHAFQALAAQPLVPAAAREWAQFERARVLASSDSTMALEALQQLANAASPSNAARAHALIAQFKGEDVISRLLALVAPQCGALSSPDADRQAYAGCVIRSRALASAQKVSVIEHLQRLLIRDGQYLTAFRAGTEALASPALQPFGTSLIPGTVHSLSLVPPQAGDARALAPELIQAASYDVESFLMALRELDRRGFGEQVRQATERLLSSADVPPRLRSSALLAQLQTAVRGRDATLAASAGRQLIETGQGDALVRRAAVRLLAQLRTSLPPDDPIAGALPLIQDALGGVETGCSSF